MRVIYKLFGIIALTSVITIGLGGCPTEDDGGGGSGNGSDSGNRKTLTLSGVSVPMRYVHEGSFQRDETAANVSVITTGYWLAETETTQELFEAVMGSNPSEFDGTSGKEAAAGETQNKRPVEMVSWYDAIAFCNKLSAANGKEAVYSVKVSGTEIDWANLTYAQIPTTDNSDWNAAVMDTDKNGYRLPTEMEWMWAAMGADKTSQPNTAGYAKAFAGSTGSNSLTSFAYYGDTSSNKTHQVGKKRENELGLLDMSGNVGEWCWDRYPFGSANTGYPDGELTDFTGVTSGANRIERGGNWNNYSEYCEIARRRSGSPWSKVNFIGFRFACP
jgi:formylglycine-generating enzyme required for sulfatase activity